MAPVNNSQASADDMRSDAPSVEASQSQSQDFIDTKTLQELLNQHKQQVKERRRERLDAINMAHGERIEKLKRDCQQADVTHEETMRAILLPKLERFLTLLEKKRVLEDRIDACAAQMTQAVTATSEKLLIIMDARIESIPT